MNQTIICRKVLFDLHARFAPIITKINFSTTLTRFETENLSLKLKSILIKPQNKITKHETFIFRSLFGEVDPFYLMFPRIASSVEEVRHLNKQYNSVCNNFSRISSDPVKLKQSGILNLNSFNSVELVHLFEAIGSSLNYQGRFKNHAAVIGDSSTNLVAMDNQITVTSQFLTRYQEKKTFLNTILPLVIHNSLILSAFQESTNSKVHELCLPNLDRLKIAFAFCEPDDNFASVPYPYWNSTAVYDKETHTWTLNGSKSRILKNNYDYYLVHCKTVNNDGKKMSDFGIATFLVDKDKVKIENDGSDNYGNKYIKIVFKDLLVSNDEELFSGTDTPTTVLNIKANGQLITSAIVLGLLKEAVRNIHHWYQSTSNFPYRALAEDRMAQVTEMIYSLESMLYLTASHFDTFELDRIDLHLEAMAIKVMANEFASQTMDMCRLLFDSYRLGKVVANDMHDVLNVLDSLLDSTVSNRLLLATYGIRSIGAWRFDHVAKMRLNQIYTKHHFKLSFFPYTYKKRVYNRFDGSMDGHRDLKKLHPSLKKSTKRLKKVLNDVTELGTVILETYGKNAINNQIDLNRFSSMMMNTFRMMAVIARANHSLSHNMPNSSEELRLCEKICERSDKQVENAKNLIYGVLEMSEEKRSATIHRRNIRFDGYFARPTFDRII